MNRLYICDDCDEVYKEDDGMIEPVYECYECGAEFPRSQSPSGDNHQCPECNRFCAKVTDTGCPDCAVALVELRRVDESEGA
jgi:ssDNA-binding Zn-finger/Zn-ribbon topoisomerase 1